MVASIRFWIDDEKETYGKEKGREKRRTKEQHKMCLCAYFKRNTYMCAYIFLFPFRILWHTNTIRFWDTFLFCVCMCVSECDKYIQFKSSMSVSSALQCSRKLNEREPWLNRQTEESDVWRGRKKNQSHSTESKTRTHCIQWNKCTNIVLKVNGRKKCLSTICAEQNDFYFSFVLDLFHFYFYFLSLNAQVANSLSMHVQQQQQQLS